MVGWRALGGGGGGQKSSGTTEPAGSGSSGSGPSGGGTSGTGTAGPALDGAAAQPGGDHVYDVVISGGRVIDPGSHFDATANVGIDGSSITAVTTGELKGRSTIDAKGLVVAPGFIDILSREPDDYGARYKLADGVTTNLGMHGLDGPVDAFLARYKPGCYVNYGGALRDPSRRQTVAGLGPAASPTADQVQQLATDAGQQIEAGWIGVDFEPEYVPGTSREEMAALAKVAKAHDVVATFHGRYSSVDQELQTIDEVAVIAQDSGARCHIEHLISTGGAFHMTDALQKLATARQQGLDISAGTFPYGFWAAPLSSTRFDPGWGQRYQISYNDLQVPGTPNRLTQATFDQLRQTDTVAVAYAIPEASVVASLQEPSTIIGSDAILTPGNDAHPAAAGCFSRVLGRYVRDQKVLDLSSALAKMTSLPATRFAGKVPALMTKGRLARGADADVTVFDPATIADRATVDNPAQESIGVEWVLVMGKQVRTPKGTQQVKAGQPVTYSA